MLKHGRYLGYRIDSDKERAFISLRMYCRYDKKNEKQKKEQQDICHRLREKVPELIFARSEEAKKHLFVVHRNESSRTASYECEIFRCYFDENVLDKETSKDFARMLRAVRNNLQLFVGFL